MRFSGFFNSPAVFWKKCHFCPFFGSDFSSSPPIFKKHENRCNFFFFQPIWTFIASNEPHTHFWSVTSARKQFPRRVDAKKSKKSWKIAIFLQKRHFSNHNITVGGSKNTQKSKKLKIKFGGWKFCKISSWTTSNHRKVDFFLCFDRFHPILTPHFR